MACASCVRVSASAASKRARGGFWSSVTTQPWASSSALALRTSELPVSAEGDRAINGTPPFWQRYLPFWASNLLERMWLVIGGLIVLLLPLSRIVPPLYTYRVRQRVFRWYARLRRIEARLDEDPGERDALLNELDELDRLANQTTVPLAHADELYALRGHIAAVRRRALAQARHQA